MNWDHPCPNFQYILFERVNPERNEHRFYYLAYGLALEGPAIIRLWGRKGGWQQAATPLPCDSLAEAWPKIRACVKRRLRRGYRIVQVAVLPGHEAPA
jgi:predicted DNA-binding WGR domain protein